MNSSKRNRWITIAKYVIGASLIAWLVLKVDLEAFVNTARGGSWPHLAIAFLLFGLSRFVEGVRLHLLVPVAEKRFGDSIDLIFVSTFFNNFAAPIVGDGYKAVRLRGMTGRMDQAIAVVLLERVLGLAALVFLGVVLLTVWPGRLAGMGSAINIDFSGFGATAFLAAALIVAAVGFYIARNRQRLVEWLLEFIAGFRSNISTANLAVAVALGVVAQLLVATMVYISVLAFGGEVNFVDNIVVMLVVYVASFIPISIGSLGVREGIIVAGFGLLGVAEPVAVAAAISTRLIMYAYALAAGMRWMALSSAAGADEQAGHG